ncbi:FAD-binding domain-containing protein [Lentithecium fluviatile CBS 122367]|uniref:Delta(24)-sterol reductase n=1 Tax=Lentithecium fluviatile CBS 122367 TaxID=1168545 RepID=A0A6G1ITK9_9PLEO|nr:FAD-binding domain-containing protein [Lentithecium fluviatile CBS 122367]
MDAHTATVARLASRVGSFNKTSTPFRIYHGSTLSTRTSSRQKDRIINTSSLNHVLTFDKIDKTVLVEPNVPMDRLVDATMAEGLLPKVVMELPNITVGGGFAGTSGESSSFRWGLFDRSIRGIEIILGNGEVVWASSENEHRELFYACAGSCGSLGVITLLEMELIEAQPYVELEYRAVRSTQEAVEAFQEAEQDPSVDYMDGIMYALDRGVVMLGKLASNPIPNRVQTFDKAADPWLYLHAEDVLRRIDREKTSAHTESVPIKTYFFRYDRGVFWSGLRAFKYFCTPFNRITRYLLDPYMYSRTMVHALHRSGLSSQAIIQDLAVPYDQAEKFVKWTDERTGLWPLWLCPVKPAPHDERSFSMGKLISHEKTLLDIGIWGMGPKDPHQFIKLNREFEAKITELNGLKCLYAHAYYTEDEFWRIYDEEAYDNLRERYHAQSLPSVYDKVKVDLKGVAGGKSVERRESWAEWAQRSFWESWPFGGLYGVASATKGFFIQSDFLLKK